MAVDGFDDDDIFKAILQFFNDDAERVENDSLGFSSLLGKRKERAGNDDLVVSKSMKTSTAEEETEDLVSNILFGISDLPDMGSGDDGGGKSSGITLELEDLFEFEKMLQARTDDGDDDDDDDIELLSVDELLQILEGQIDQ